MTNQVHCICLNEPAAIERALRVIRVRGFNITAMDTRLSEGKVLATFSVQSDRDINGLLSQLQKLASIQSVILQHPPKDQFETRSIASQADNTVATPIATPIAI